MAELMGSIKKVFAPDAYSMYLYFMATVKSFPLMLLAAVIVTACGLFQPDPVTAPELKEHVSILAADGMEGRMVGTEGIKKAEAYIAGEMKRAGLKELTEGYFQPFVLQAEMWETEAPLLTVTITAGSDGEKNGSGLFYYDLENYPLPGTVPTGREGIEGEIVFAGYGIDAPEYGYNDYETLDVKGKIVLVFRHEPNEKDPNSVFEGSRHSRYATFLYKMGIAKEKGAVGLILFDDPLHHSGEGPFAPVPGFASFPEEGTDGNGNTENALPGVHVSADRVMRLYPAVDFKRIQTALDKGGKVPELPAAKGKILLYREENTAALEGRNVAGFIPSRGNRSGDLSDEERVLIIGAHHDHLGSFAEGREGDRIFNGADDNASGVAAVLELAEYFKRKKLSVGLLFITFSAEELGLYGSRLLLRGFPGLKERTIAMINFDMIGRNPEEKIILQYTGTTEFQDAAEGLLEDDFRVIRQRTDRGYISDSYVFYKEGIPTVYFFTGLHEDYHRPSDEAELLDYARMERITKTAALLIEAFSTSPGEKNKQITPL